MTDTLQRLHKDERGAVMVMFAMFIGLMLVGGALAIDAGRVTATHSEMQSFVDNIALAAAAELDGKVDAIDRATAAGRSAALDDYQTFGAGQALDASDTTALSFRFLSGLPASDGAPIPSSLDTNNDADAAYVLVRTATPKSVYHYLAEVGSKLTGGPDIADAQVIAEAVAGRKQFVCDITPMFFCTPGPNYEPVPGRMIHLRSGGSGAAYQPGNFGFLDLNFDPDAGCGNPNQGANFFRCVLGRRAGTTRCFESSGVNARPGQMTGAAASGFNTRFDIYLTNLNPTADFTPAPNVVKGIVKNGGGGGCIGNNPQATTDSMALPRDNCFDPDSGLCTGTVGDRFGNSSAANPQWDRAGYLATNHGSSGWTPPLNAGGYSTNTRYGLYLAEIDRANAISATEAIITDTDAVAEETGRPYCNTTVPADQLSPQRRLLVAAAIDCAANPFNGNAASLPVESYVRVFVTEPVIADGGSNTDVWVEEVELVARGDGSGGTGEGFVHDVVQLYR